MIKPVTFQGLENFKANLYAVEVRSRFINQAEAHGYYKNYGAELAASIVGNNIVIGTGAFVICGRMNEVVTDETITVNAANGQVGYIVAHIETYRPSDEGNCIFIAKTGASLATIPLTKDDIYTTDSDSTNKVFEWPIYSFAISGGGIQNLTRLLPAVADYSTVKQIADAANNKATNAVATADAAANTASAANSTAQNALQTAQNAVNTAGAAVTTSNAAKNTAEQAVTDIAQYKTQTTAAVAQYQNETTAEVAQLAEQIGEKQGTTVKAGGAAVATLDFDNDTININGGKA